ncbi:MAG: GNAT family N-acetyltransferase [Fusobacteriaceae bacterium]
MSIKFIKPHLDYFESYIFAMTKIVEGGFISREIFLAMENKTPQEFIDSFKIMETEKCTEVLPYLVPATAFWLVDTDKKKFVGLLSVRHRLNELLNNWGGHIGYSVNPEYRRQGHGHELLKFGLKFCKEELGLTEILITCDEKNLASKKIIESGGGQFINIYKHEDSDKISRRYKIEL